METWAEVIRGIAGHKRRPGFLGATIMLTRSVGDCSTMRD